MFGFTILILSSILGSVVSADFDGNPCSTGVLELSHAENTRPGLALGHRNTYRGEVSLEHWPNVPRVELTVLLDNPKRFKLEVNNGRVIKVDGGYKIIYNQPSSTVPKVTFSLRRRGNPHQVYSPEVTGLFLNDNDICNIIEATY